MSVNWAKFARWARSILEIDAFVVDHGLRRRLRDDPLSPAVRTAFARHGVRLAPDAFIFEASGWKWKLRSERAVWVIRDRSEFLLVSRERSPDVSRLLAWVDTASANARQSVRDNVFYATATLRKRYLDRGDQLLVNVGSGKWYQRGWRVIDHTGKWYRYSGRFIDYPLDLMRKCRYPFADASVDRFYSEHVFEHFPNDVGAFGFAEMHRALRPGGGLRIVVPDADLLYEKFRTKDERFFAPWMTAYNATLTEAFIILVGYPDGPLDDTEVQRSFDTLEKHAFFDRYTQHLRYDYARAGEHVNWFNFAKLSRMLRAAGFHDVTRSAPQMSRFQEIRGPRFDTRPHYSLHVDAVK